MYWRWLPGVRRAWQFVCSRWPAGLLSYGFPEIQRAKLFRLLKLQAASPVIFARELGLRKSEPALFEHALIHTGYQPQEVLFIGDSYEADIKPLARSAGGPCGPLLGLWGAQLTGGRIMRKRMPILLLCSMALASSAWAQPVVGGPLGVGLQLGPVTGLTAKQFLSRRYALEGLMAWRLDKYFFMEAHASQHWLAQRLTEVPGRIVYYAGLGGYGRFESDAQRGHADRWGLSGTGGMALFIGRIEFYMHFSPKFALWPATALDMTGGLGARLYLF